MAWIKVAEGQSLRLEEVPQIDWAEHGPDEDQARFEGFNGRVPIIWHPEHKTVYVGGPNWFHSDLQSYYGLSYWTPHKGYIGKGGSWERGLHWYTPPAGEHKDHVEKAVLQRFPDAKSEGGHSRHDPWDEDDVPWDDH